MKMNRCGTVSIEAVLAIATGALVLLGVMEMANSSLLSKANETVAKLFNLELSSQSTNSNTSGQPSSSSDDSNNSGSNSNGNSDSQGGGNGNAVEPDSGVDDGRVGSVGGDVFKDSTLEAFKNKIEKIIDKTPHEKFTKKVMAVVDAINAVDGLLQAEKDIAKLNAEGKLSLIHI